MTDIIKAPDCPKKFMMPAIVAARSPPMSTQVKKQVITAGPKKKCAVIRDRLEHSQKKEHTIRMPWQWESRSKVKGRFNPNSYQ
jgi:hypothetical protein